MDNYRKYQVIRYFNSAVIVLGGKREKKNTICQVRIRSVTTLFRPLIVLILFPQLRRWSGWRRCAPIRWCQAHTRPPSAGGANSPTWGACSSPGSGGRRRARSSSRRLQVRTLPPAHISDSRLMSRRLHLATVALMNGSTEEQLAIEGLCRWSSIYDYGYVRLVKHRQASGQLLLLLLLFFDHRTTEPLCLVHIERV